MRLLCPCRVSFLPFSVENAKRQPTPGAYPGVNSAAVTGKKTEKLNDARISRVSKPTHQVYIADQSDILHGVDESDSMARAAWKVGNSRCPSPVEDHYVWVSVPRQFSLFRVQGGG